MAPFLQNVHVVCPWDSQAVTSLPHFLTFSKEQNIFLLDDMLIKKIYYDTAEQVSLLNYFLEISILLG